MNITNIIKKIILTRLAMFAVIFTTLMTLSSILNKTSYLYDSIYYWQIADPVFENGFNILNFPETFRGYLFLVLVGIVKQAVYRLGINGYWGWRILISGMVSATLVYVLPMIFHKNDNTHIGWKDYVSNAIFILIFCVFWGDYIQYPLSDFPACFFILTGTAVLVRVKDKPNRIHKIVDGIISGAFLYAAYNTRTAFLYGILIAVMVFVIYILREKSYKNLLVLMSLVIGLFLAAAPQMIINHQYLGSWDPKVHTEQWFTETNGLQLQQVFWGLEMSRYETYTGHLADYPKNDVRFDDPIGQKMIGLRGITEEEFSYVNIVKLLIRQPLDMLGLYTRHLISLMTPVYSQIYITDMYVEKGIIISLAILIWMTAAINILFNYKKKFDKMTLCMLFAMVVPSLLQLAGAPELRFFLMAYLLLYYYVTNIIDYKKMYRNIKKNWMPILIVCAAVYCMWISNIGMTLGNNSETPLFIDDHHYECVTETW